MENLSLWPSLDLNADPGEPLPIDVLREQELSLPDATQKLLRARIESTIPEKNEGLTYHDFYIIAPLANGTEVKLFYLKHNIPVYPVTVVDRHDEEFGSRCSNSEALRERLKELFNSDDVKRVILDLIRIGSSTQYAAS